MNFQVGDLANKSIFYICVTFIMFTLISQCALNIEIIEKCRQACTTTFSHMNEVTTKKCSCAEDLESEWVIPR